MPVAFTTTGVGLNTIHGVGDPVGGEILLGAYVRGADRVLASMRVRAAAELGSARDCPGRLHRSGAVMRTLARSIYRAVDRQRAEVDERVDALEREEERLRRRGARSKDRLGAVFGAQGGL